MRVEEGRPDWPGRDRFVLSAGHKALVLYAVLAARGLVPEDLLDTYGRFATALPGHPACTSSPGWRYPPTPWGTAWRWPWAWPSGSGCRGWARASSLMGDGEQAEGSIWEAAAAELDRAERELAEAGGDRVR